MTDNAEDIVDAAWDQYMAAKGLASARIYANRATENLAAAERTLADARQALRILEARATSSDALHDMLLGIALSGGGK